MNRQRRLRQTLARGAAALPDAAAAAARAYVERCRTGEGGFAGRDGRQDLYYSSFAYDCCLALSLDLPRQASVWLTAFGDGGTLDVPHAAALLRSWAAVYGDAVPAARRAALRVAVERVPGTVYEHFLLALAAEAIGLPPAVGGVPVDPLPPVAATAAARVLLGDAPATTWLRTCWDASGGCRAFPEAPVPDLLSTAVAAFALAPNLPVPPAVVRDFVLSLWLDDGVFRATALDTEGDCEYLWYGLLALGNAVVSRPR